MKRLFTFLYDVLWANYALSHRLYTGEWPDKDKQ